MSKNRFPGKHGNVFGNYNTSKEENGFNNVLFIDTNYETNFSTPRKAQKEEIYSNANETVPQCLTPTSNSTDLRQYLTNDLLDKIEETNSPFKSLKSGDAKKMSSKEIYLINSELNKSESYDEERIGDILNNLDIDDNLLPEKNGNKSTNSLKHKDYTMNVKEIENSVNNYPYSYRNLNSNFNNNPFGILPLNYGFQFHSGSMYSSNNMFISPNSNKEEMLCNNNNGFVSNNNTTNEINGNSYHNNIIRGSQFPISKTAYLSNDDKLINRKIVDNQITNFTNNKFNTFYNNNSPQISNTNTNPVFVVNPNPYTETKSTFMYGKQGWICLSCNNFNYESI